MPEPIDGFPYVISQEVLWRDMDAFQHVNNATYLRYFEDVRMKMLVELGMIEFMASDRIGPILASTRCEFRAPLTYPDRIRIGARIEDLKPRRFTMKYGVFSEQLESIAAEGEGILVYYDYAQERSCEIPRQFVPLLQALQHS